MNDFQFAQAQDLRTALEQLSASPECMPLAGGTNVLVNLKRASLQTDLVLDLSRVDTFKSIIENDDEVQLGCGVTFAQVMQWHPGGAIEQLLRPMAAAFAGPLIRNLATVGGNICDASPAADVSPPLLVLDARVKLESAGKEARWLSLDEFFLGVRQTARRADELLTSVAFAKPDSSARAFYYKLGKRKADAISIVSVAILLQESAGKVDHVRIALGAVAPVAMRAHKAETELLGEKLSERNIVAAAQTAATEVSPIDDFRGSAAYRRRMVEVLVKRGLTQIAATPGQNK